MTRPRVLLISTYDLGHQSFGLASPAGWLRREGVDVELQDLTVESLDEDAVRAADVIGFYLPMHTATRIASTLLPRVKRLNPAAHICAFGLYSGLNEGWLKERGVDSVLGGEFEADLVSLVQRLGAVSGSGPMEPDASKRSGRHLKFVVPDRRGLRGLAHYAHLIETDGRTRIVGYTESTRGCKHRCRHCPVVPVYDGRFHVVQREIVLEDIRRQVTAGARHITFGDPDFFNGIGHALPIVRALHREHPLVTYDVTIKIEHLLAQAKHLGTLRETGCLFVTTAVEALDDRVLAKLRKGHTVDDFVRVLDLFREIGLDLSPTFVTFTPWITPAGYRDLLARIAELGIEENVAPIQLAIRLLIFRGSRLLELEEIRDLVEPFDDEVLVHPWKHPDPRVDLLHAELEARIGESLTTGLDRRQIFRQVWEIANRHCGDSSKSFPARSLVPSRGPIPYLSEPWYC